MREPKKKRIFFLRLLILTEYLEGALRRSEFESEVPIEQVERIVTLSTCTYQGVDKRFILVCELAPC